MVYPEGLNMQTVINVKHDRDRAEEIVRLLLDELAEIMARIGG